MHWKAILSPPVAAGTLLVTSALWQFAVFGSSASLFYRQESVLLASTAAGVIDYHHSLPGRLAEAVFVATELRRSDSYFQLICPSNQEIGMRPPDHIPPAIGTTCEAWANREWMEVVWQVVDRNMMALEWSSGSGSLWTLRRGLTLHTVEHW